MIFRRKSFHLFRNTGDEHLSSEERKQIEKLKDSPNIVPGAGQKKSFFQNLFG